MITTQKRYILRTKRLKELTIKQYENKEQYYKIKDEKRISNKGKIEKSAQQVDYLEQYIQRRVEDESNVMKYYSYFDTQFNNICLWINDDDALITQNEIETLQFIHDMTRRYPDLVLDVALLFPDPPDIIKAALDDKRLFNPNDQVINEAFTYDPESKKYYDIKYRYLCNMQGDYVRRYLNHDKIDDNIRTNAQLFSKLSNQSRWNSIWLQIFATFLYSDNVSEGLALQNTNLKTNNIRRKATDLITLQTIAYILKHFSELPFSVRANGVIDVHQVEYNWGTCIVPLLYSLLELSKEEKGCNVNEDFLIPIIRYRVECAYTSFETETLNKKGIYSSMIRWLSTRVGVHVRNEIDKNCTTTRAIYCNKIEEIFLSDEVKKEFEDEVRDKCDKMFFDTINKYVPLMNSSDHCKNTETLRWLSNVCLTMGNAGIYYKTALSLESVASVEARVANLLNYPKPKNYWMFQDAKILACNNWDTGAPIWKQIYERYVKMSKPHLHIYNANLEEEFFTLLTNKSQGFKVESENFSQLHGIPLQLQQQIRNVAQVRIASFLLSNDTFHVLPAYLAELQRTGMCTIRYQNNRRARIVEIVPNVDQIAYALVLRMFEEIKIDSDDIAVGKQIGGIVDMTLQLRTTGSRYSVSIYSDVAAMDAHTQPNLSIIFLQSLAQLMTENRVGPRNYFPFQTEELVMTNAFNDLDSININAMQQPIYGGVFNDTLPSQVQALLMVAINRMEKKYDLKDNVLNVTIPVNPSIFESGRFDTSAQHSTLLKILADITYAQVSRNLPEFNGKYTSERRKFGDDSFEAITNCQDYDDQITIIKQVVENTNSMLFQVGLKGETELSRFFGDFLQQMGVCGSVLPKSARASIYTDERSSLISRSPIDLITNMSNIITASAQRVFAPTNVMPLVRSIWLLNNTVQLISKSVITLPERLRKYVKKTNGKRYINYPYITINLPPLNFPNQNMQLSDSILLPKTSWVRTVGYAKLLWMWNEVFSLSSREQLFQTYTKGEEVLYVDPYDVAQEQLAGTDIIEALTLLQFKRSQRLTKNRTEELHDVIEAMGKRAMGYFNPTVLQRSLLASMELKSRFGIKLPDGIVYYRKPYEQLKNMFASRAETVDESENLGYQFTTFLLKHFKQTINKEVRTMFNNTAVFFNPNANNLTGYIQNFKFPLLPGYWNGSDYNRVMELVGSALLAAQRSSKTTSSFSSRYNGAFDLEAIQKFGIQAKQKDENALSLFFDALNLPARLETVMRDLINADSTMILDDLYKSGFQPDQNFAISDSMLAIHKRLIFPNLATNSMINNLILMLRDYLFLTIHKAPLDASWSVLLTPGVLSYFRVKQAAAQAGMVVR